MNCRKDTENINPKVLGTSNGKAIRLSKCAICSNKKSRFIKNQNANRLLSNLSLKTLLSKSSILGVIFFFIRKFLLTGNKFLLKCI